VSSDVYLNQAGILPDENLVLTVSVGGDQLAGVLRPGQVAYLEKSVIKELSSNSPVPNINCSEHGSGQIK